MIRAIFFLVLVALVAMVPAVSAVLVGAVPGPEDEVRSVVQRSFQQLKDGQYSELYDGLPAAARKRIARASFVQNLQRSRNLYRLDRIEIGTVKVNGNNATAETVMYGRVLKPNENEGKIVVRQSLVREGGAWHLAVNNTSPRIYIKRDGRWVEVTKLLKAASKR
ncbi:MAG: hypothetical protein ABIZ95_19050 [Pyrinomonadaceae bacterium]